MDKVTAYLRTRNLDSFRVIPWTSGLLLSMTELFRNFADGTITAISDDTLKRLGIGRHGAMEVHSVLSHPFPRFAADRASRRYLLAYLGRCETEIEMQASRIRQAARSITTVTNGDQDVNRYEVTFGGRNTPVPFKKLQNAATFASAHYGVNPDAVADLVMAGAI